MSDDTTVLPGVNTPGFHHSDNGRGSHAHSEILGQLVLSSRISDDSKFNLKSIYDASNNTAASLERFGVAIRDDLKDAIFNSESRLSDIRKEMVETVSALKTMILEKTHCTESLIRNMEENRLRAELAAANVRLASLQVSA